MHFLAFLFFSGLIAASVLLIRAMFAESSAKIEDALAGEYRLAAARPAPVYVARRRPALRTATAARTTFLQRLAA